MNPQSVLAITGAAAGIGRVVALRAVASGHAVAAIDRNKAALRELAAEAPTGRIMTFPLDLADRAQVVDMATRVADSMGTPHGLICCAAVPPTAGSLIELDESDWHAVLSVNLTGTFFAAQAIGRQMASAGHGALVGVSSIAGHTPVPDAGAYSTSKAAVLMLFRQLALELGPLGVRANTISPGLIDAGMATEINGRPGVREQRSEQIPLRRLGLADDVADTALFLCSEQSAYITGQDILVDGGLTTATMLSVRRE